MNLFTRYLEPLFIGDTRQSLIFYRKIIGFLKNGEVQESIFNIETLAKLPFTEKNKPIGTKIYDPEILRKLI